MRPFRPLPACILLAMALVPISGSAHAGYWENQIDFPPLLESDPPGIPAPDFKREGIHLLSALEVRTDLGRKQIREIDSLVGDQRLTAGIFTMDRVAGEWTRKYIEDFRRDNSVTIPLYSIVDEGLRGIFRGYDTGRMQAFPHTLLVDSRGSIHRIFEGVISAEALSGALDEARDPELGVNPEAGSGGENLILNGDFEVESETGAPEAWGVHNPEEKPLLGSADGGWKGSAGLEIRSTTEKVHHIGYQVIPHVALLGKQVELQGLARSNSIGLPRIDLTVPHPQIEEGFDFAPSPVLRTQTGRGIPLRILGSLNFTDGRSNWQQQAVNVEIPPDARAVIVLIYLDNPQASGGAALFDEVSLRPVD